MAEFERDIVLANDDGKVYHIPQEVLSTLEPVNLESNKYQLIASLLRQGVSTAAIPTPDDSGPEPDAYCYLVNLASLKQATPYE